MTCVRIPNGIICFTPEYRLRLADGTCVFMSWHNFCGPEFYKDKAMNRLYDNWWDNPLIEDALNWFIGRGEIA